jgi:hypothetical protein
MGEVAREGSPEIEKMEHPCQHGRIASKTFIRTKVKQSNEDSKKNTSMAVSASSFLSRLDQQLDNLPT